MLYCIVAYIHLDLTPVFPRVERCALNRAEYMVGMSGKASEPRRGHSTQQKKAAVGPVGPGGSNKTQPPPEALHVANILGDGIYPADLAERMKQVLNTLPTSTEEEVCIALHDHDFDPTRAITALLDSDAQTSSQVEWLQCVWCGVDSDPV